MERSEASMVSWIPAAVGGLAGALVGAGVWAALAAATDSEIGYVAVLVGFLAGAGVRLGARGASLPLLAIACAVFGLVAAKYMTLAYFVFDKYGVSPLSGRMFSFFGDHFSDFLEPMDILFMFLAVGAAARAARPAVAK